MEDDELVPRPETTLPRKLEGMSIEALRAYIAELEAEISRVRQDIAAKERAAGVAESVFRK